MIKLSEEKIKRIAQDIECSLVCYVNKTTLETNSLPDRDAEYYVEDELLDKEIDEFENNIEAYVKIKKMRSSESYKIMEDFAKQVSDEEFQKTLINTLEKRKPFRNFKHEVESSIDYRQAWFDFKSKRFQQHVSQVLELANYDEEE